MSSYKYYKVTISQLMYKCPSDFSSLHTLRRSYFYKWAVALLGLASGTLQAQTQEAIRFVTTQPVGTSLTLEGTLTLSLMPGKKPVPVVLLIAGSGPVDRDGNAPEGSGGPKSMTYRQLADSLSRRGVAVLRFDKRGSGINRATFLSQKLYEKSVDFNQGVADAVGFIRQLQADHRFSSVTVAGHSEGALVGMLAAVQTGVARYVSMAGPGRNIADMLKMQFVAGGVQDEALRLANGVLDSLKAGHTVRQPPLILAQFFAPANQPYLISWMKYDPAEVIKSVKGPILIIQGRHDIQVPVTEAELLKAARPDARLVMFDTMSHILKVGPAERGANITTYSDPALQILPAVADEIANFVK